MRIVFVSGFYSEGMGYSENCLPKALAALGHDVHVVTSNLNVYGNSTDYHKTYALFLGPADQGVGKFKVDGYIVHRLPSKSIFGYVYITKLYEKIKELSPVIVQSTEIASFQTFLLAIIKPLFKFRLYGETHQHMSVLKPYLKNTKGHLAKRFVYRLTRTLPSHLASKVIEKCYAIAPDCVEVAHKYYGVPRTKIKLQPLGTDTDLFRPAISDLEIKKRANQRNVLGYSDDDIICIYTGRFSEDKNPLVLAKAIERLSSKQLPFYGLFIGDGPQSDQIKYCSNVTVLPFMKHKDLADYYRLADIAVWPTQESMSMLDAASCGLPLIVSDQIGEAERINENGKLYHEGDIIDLSNVILSFLNINDRSKYGQHGRAKMVNNYSWIKIATEIEKDYLAVL